MNHKEEAEELVDKFWNHEYFEHTNIKKAERSSKDFAIVCLNYTIEQFRKMVPSPYKGHINDLIKIKEEIENM